MIKEEVPEAAEEEELQEEGERKRDGWRGMSLLVEVGARGRRSINWSGGKRNRTSAAHFGRLRRIEDRRAFRSCQSLPYNRRGPSKTRIEVAPLPIDGAEDDVFPTFGWAHFSG